MPLSKAAAAGRCSFVWSLDSGSRRIHFRAAPHADWGLRSFNADLFRLFPHSNVFARCWPGLNAALVVSFVRFCVFIVSVFFWNRRWFQHHPPGQRPDKHNQTSFTFSSFLPPTHISLVVIMSGFRFPGFCLYLLKNTHTSTPSTLHPPPPPYRTYGCVPWWWGWSCRRTAGSHGFWWFLSWCFSVFFWSPRVPVQSGAGPVWFCVHRVFVAGSRSRDREREREGEVEAAAGWWRKQRQSVKETQSHGPDLHTITQKYSNADKY